MNFYPFDRIPIVDPKDVGKIIEPVTTNGIMKLLTETKRKLGFRKIWKIQYYTGHHHKYN
jgi:hypothetical protein